MWIVAASLSAVFAGLTAILSKCGVKQANATVASAIRTSVVLVLAWVIVLKERLPPKAWAGLALLVAGTVCMAVGSTGLPTV